MAWDVFYWKLSECGGVSLPVDAFECLGCPFILFHHKLLQSFLMVLEPDGFCKPVMNGSGRKEKSGADAGVMGHREGLW